MPKFRLNSALRYLNGTNHRESATRIVHVVNQAAGSQDLSLVLTKGCTDEFCPDDRSFTSEPVTLTTEQMQEMSTINLHTEPAYLVWREKLDEGGTGVSSRPVPSEEVVRLESTANYCYVHTSDGEYNLVALSLRWVAHHLQGFVRCHRSHAVNPLYIADMLIGRQEIGEIDRYMRLTTGEKIPWSRRHLKEARRAGIVQS